MNGSRNRRFASGTAGSNVAVGLTMVGLRPISSRWTWQPRLPELWLSEQERLRFRKTIHDLKKKV